MFKLLFKYILIIALWVAIYPVTLLCHILFDKLLIEELVWQIQFESHYLLITRFVSDWLDAIYISSIWLVVIIICQAVRKTRRDSVVKWFLFLYPLILIAILLLIGIPSIYWQMAITGWMFNWFFMGTPK
jgi:hypothetical protein